MLRTAKQISLRTKTILSLVCFAVVLAALVVVATFYDLQISQLLTKHSLEPYTIEQGNGGYISYNGFALFFEALGSCPIYLMASVIGAIVFWFFLRKQGKIRILSVIGVVLAVGGFAYTIKDTYNYVAEYIASTLDATDMLTIAAKDASNAGYVMALSVVLGALPATGLLLAWQRISKETNDKMIWWAFAILATIALYLIPHFVKGPVGRARFRTMNFLGDFSYYTRWYELNGKRVMTADGLVPSTAETKAAAIVATDACKSFPSGHTFSAGIIYTLLALPYLSDKCAKKGVKIGLWCGTIAFVGLVAVSRIVAGAHYMSDVLFGGTIAFAGAIIMREIFVCKGCHVKALFGKKAVTVEEAPAQDAETPAE